MAASVSASTTSAQSSDTTSHTASLAAYSAGDILCVFIAVDGSSGTISVPTGWSQGWTDELESSGHKFALRYKIADGSEGSTLAFTTSTSDTSAHIALTIVDHDDTLDATRAESSSAGTSVDPPSHTPAGGSKEYLWIACGGWDTDATVSAWPTGYDSNQLSKVTGAGSTGCGCAVATKVATGTSDNPAAFTISASEDWSAATIAIGPGAGGVTINHVVGTILLGAGTHVPGDTLAHSAGSLVLGAGTHQFTEAMPHSAGTLVLGGTSPSFTETLPAQVGTLALGASAHAVSTGGDITISHEAGALLLGAGTHAPSETLQASAATLALNGGTHVFTESFEPTAASLVLGATAPTIEGSEEADVYDDSALFPWPYYGYW